VQSLKPKQPTKPSTFWVAVLKADIKRSSSGPSDTTSEEDFLWIKCHGEIKAGVIRHQYEMKNPADSGEGKIKLRLASGNVVMDNETMRELDYFNDQLVVFEVVKGSDTSSPTTSSPSKASDSVSSAPGGGGGGAAVTSASHASRIRSPLKPTTNHQIAAALSPPPPLLPSSSSSTSTPRNITPDDRDRVDGSAKKDAAKMLGAKLLSMGKGPKPPRVKAEDNGLQDENRNPLTGVRSSAGPIPGHPPRRASNIVSPAAAPAPVPIVPKPEPVPPTAPTAATAAGMVVSKRPDWATSNGFNLYAAQFRDKLANKISRNSPGNLYSPLPPCSFLICETVAVAKFEY
jgi:hypothetical protein